MQNVSVVLFITYIFLYLCSTLLSPHFLFTAKKSESPKKHMSVQMARLSSFIFSPIYSHSASLFLITLSFSYLYSSIINMHALLCMGGVHKRVCSNCEVLRKNINVLCNFSCFIVDVDDSYYFSLRLSLSLSLSFCLLICGSWYVCFLFSAEIYSFFSFASYHHEYQQ